jgi:bifunctional UDP-N-acetylglucosamine pyrophosphorylase/glucosamine-1-phosphate N-acetyltransferase
MKVAAVILAAGKGVRMCSSLPKVAHQAAGKAMIVHIVEAVEKAGIDEIKVVVGHGREVVQSLLSSKKVEFVIQEQQLIQQDQHLMLLPSFSLLSSSKKA